MYSPLDNYTRFVNNNNIIPCCIQNCSMCTYIWLILYTLVIYTYIIYDIYIILLYMVLYIQWLYILYTKYVFLCDAMILNEKSFLLESLTASAENRAAWIASYPDLATTQRVMFCVSFSGISFDIKGLTNRRSRYLALIHASRNSRSESGWARMLSSTWYANT